MSTPAVSTLELRAIDTVLGMGGGYVLDFTDRTFAEFFRDHGVQIDDPRYSVEGGSKAKRLRYFLRITPPPLSGKVLAALLEYCLASSGEVEPGAWATAAEVAARLGGVPPRLERPTPEPAPAMTEQELLARSLQPEAVAAATRDPAMAAIVQDRLQEAERCLGVEAYLAAVILAGSVLEALCLDFGAQHPERVNRASRWHTTSRRLSSLTGTCGNGSTFSGRRAISRRTSRSSATGCATSARRRSCRRDG